MIAHADALSRIIDEVPVRAHNAHVGVLLEERDVFADDAEIPDVVIVPDTDELTARAVEAEVVIAVQADVAIVTDVADAVVDAHQAAHDLRRLVLGRVVADHNFDRRVVLSRNGLHALAQARRAIACRNAD